MVESSAARALKLFNFGTPFAGGLEEDARGGRFAVPRGVTHCCSLPGALLGLGVAFFMPSSLRGSLSLSLLSLASATRVLPLRPFMVFAHSQPLLHFPANQTLKSRTTERLSLPAQSATVLPARGSVSQAQTLNLNPSLLSVLLLVLLLVLASVSNSTSSTVLLLFLVVVTICNRIKHDSHFFVAAH